MIDSMTHPGGPTGDEGGGRMLPGHLSPDDFASFGARSWIAAPAVVKSPGRISIGDDVQVFPRAWLSVVEEHLGTRYEPRLTIGDRVKLGHDLVIACIGEVVIEDDVLVSDRVFIGDTSHGFSDPDTPVHAQPMTPPKPVRIGRGAFLGVGSIVLGGVSIGPNGYVAAGAVVTKDVPARTVVAGNPAVPIKKWDGRAWVPQR